jgi:hypothetical protein
MLQHSKIDRERSTSQRICLDVGNGGVAFTAVFNDLLKARPEFAALQVEAIGGRVFMQFASADCVSAVDELIGSAMFQLKHSSEVQRQIDLSKNRSKHQKLDELERELGE